MKKGINKLITLIKKEDFHFDDRVSYIYLFQLLFYKFINLIYGFFIFKKFTFIFVHPTSRIRCSNKIKFESNLSIDMYSYIDAISTQGITFGRNCSVGKFTTIECSGSLNNLGCGLIVGNNVGLGTRSHYGCAGGITIGDDTIIGNFVSFHSENHNFLNNSIPIRNQGVNRKGIKIGSNCWIGAKVTILDGVEIGNGCVIAAGSLVNKSFSDNSIIAGVPAKFLKFRTISFE